MAKTKMLFGSGAIHAEIVSFSLKETYLEICVCVFCLICLYFGTLCYFVPSKSKELIISLHISIYKVCISSLFCQIQMENGNGKCYYIYSLYAHTHTHS